MNSHSNTPSQIDLIAEIGINHDGKSSVANLLISEAASAGVSSIKFQYRNLKRLEKFSYFEIGDQIVTPELKKNYLQPGEIIKLGLFAKELGLRVGISFFSVEDLKDFSDDLALFDFFKVPSVEMLNDELIGAFLASGKPTLISTGAHSLVEIDNVLSKLKGGNWMPLYCVSNYPLALHNLELLKIPILRQYGHGVGYSSHDERWESILLTLPYGVSVVERHIKLDDGVPGLDKSTSSTPAELALLASYLKAFPFISRANVSATPNQGELINRQNLGQSLYAIEELRVGTLVNPSEIVYRSPQVGIHRGNFEKFRTFPLKKKVPAGNPVTASHFLEDRVIDPEDANTLTTLKIGVPARCHDYLNVRESLKVEIIEFHLDFNEISAFETIPLAHFSNELTVHLPDYIGSTELIDPFSSDNSVKSQSIQVIDKIISRVSEIQNERGASVNVTGSFPSQDKDSSRYFDLLSSLLEHYRTKFQVNIFPQWLPPFAWYFGGSFRLEQFNNQKAIDLIREYNMEVCLDTSHFLLSSNFEAFDAVNAYESIKNNIGYFHLGGASGIDGEGKGIEEFFLSHSKLFSEIIQADKIKICEVWQGHLDDFSGFRTALHKIISFVRNESE